jgi:hypothetical protein
MDVPPGLNGSDEVVHSNSTNGALHQTEQGTSAGGLADVFVAIGGIG